MCLYVCVQVDIMYEGVTAELYCPRQYLQGSARDVGQEVVDAPPKARAGKLERARTAGRVNQWLICRM